MTQQALSHEDTISFYDRFGSKQDKQAFYEDKALEDLISHSDLARAASLFELGCGTGRLAERLMERPLPPHAQYTGVDVSSTMVQLAQKRLARFGSRATVRRVEPAAPFAGSHGPFDRIITTYVLDLMSDEDLGQALDSCAALLTPEGKLCIASITTGRSLFSRIVMAGWKILFRISPSIVGGCRPINLVRPLSARSWEIEHHSVVSSYGIASEIIVAHALR